MGLKIEDATKEELIQYFREQTERDRERILLWLAKKRAGEMRKAQDAAMDTEQESLRKYIETVKAFNEEKDIDKKLQLAQKAKKYYEQYQKAERQITQLDKKLDTIYDF